MRNNQQSQPPHVHQEILDPPLSSHMLGYFAWFFLSSVDFFSFFNTVIQKYHRVDANQVRHMVEHDLVDDTINIQITQKVNHLQNATLKGQCHKYLFCPPVITFVVYWQPKQTVGIQTLRLKKTLFHAQLNWAWNFNCS